MKYSTYIVSRFPAIHFMFYRGKSIFFGTVYTVRTVQVRKMASLNSGSMVSKKESLSLVESFIYSIVGLQNAIFEHKRLSKN